MKRIKLSLVLCTVIGLAATACSAATTTTTEISVAENATVAANISTDTEADDEPVDVFYDEYDAMKLSFDDAVEYSASVVSAKCMGLKRATKQSRVYSFELVDTLVGMKMPSTFELTVFEGEYSVDGGDAYKTDTITYNEDCVYLLPLVKYISVFYSSDLYTSAGDAVIQLADNGDVISAAVQGREHEKLLFSCVDEFRKVKYSCGQSEDETGTKYVVTNDPITAADVSEYIFEAEIASVFREADDRTVYNCNILNTYKAAEKFDKVVAALPKDSVQIGDKVVLALNRSGETSVVYVISTTGGSMFLSGSENASKLILAAQSAAN